MGIVECGAEVQTNLEPADAFQDLVEASNVHVLHQHDDVTLIVPRVKEPHDVWRVTLVEDLQFSQNLLHHLRFSVERNLFLGQFQPL